MPAVCLAQHYRSMENQSILKHGFSLTNIWATTLPMIQKADVSDKYISRYVARDTIHHTSR